MVGYSKQYTFIPLTITLFLLSFALVPTILGQERKENFYSVLKAHKDKEIEAKKLSDAEKAKRNNGNNIANTTEQENGEESGNLNALNRFEKIWGPRLYPHGDVTIASRAIADYARKQQAASNGIRSKSTTATTIDPQWQCVGPVGNYSEDFDDGKGLGHIHTIGFHPDYATNKIMYCGSPFSGLWRCKLISETEYEWKPASDDPDLPLKCVADIATAKSDGISYVFITTGNGDDELPARIATVGYINPEYTIGIWRAIDNGGTATGDFNLQWEHISVNLMNSSPLQLHGTIRKMIIHPTNKNIAYIATTDGIYKTTNLLATPADVVSWSRLTNCPVDDQLKGLEFNPANASIIVASGEKVYQFNETNQAWTTYPDPPAPPSTTPSIPLQVVRSNVFFRNYLGSITLWAYFKIPMSSGTTHSCLYYYSGTRWIFVHNQENSPNIASPNRIPFVMNSNGSKFFYGDAYLWGNPININTFESSQYSGYGLHADIHALEMDPVNPNILWIGHDGGLSKKDITQSMYNTGYKAMVNGLVLTKIWAMDNHPFDTQTKITGLQCNGTYIHSNVNNVTAWRHVRGADGYNGVFGKYKNKAYGMIQDQNSYDLYYRNSVNEPWSWAPQGSHSPSKFDIEVTPSLIPSNRREFWGHEDVVKDADGNVIERWGVIKENTTSVLSNNSLVSAQEAALKGQIPRIGELAISPSDPRVAYCTELVVQLPDPEDGELMAEKLYKVTKPSIGNNFNIVVNLSINLLYALQSDTDATWEYQFLPLISSIVIHPTNPNKIWVSFQTYLNGFQVWHSLDGGYSWENSDDNSTLPYALPVNELAIQDMGGGSMALYAATEVGVFVKKDDSQLWEPYGATGPNCRVTDIKVNYFSGKLSVGTFGRGAWECNLLPSDGFNFTEVIQENTTISEDTYLQGNLVVDNNAILTVNGNIHLYPKSTITVNPGCSVVINNGKFVTGHNCADFTLNINGYMSVQSNELQFPPNSTITVGSTGVLDILAPTKLCFNNTVNGSNSIITNTLLGGMIRMNGKDCTPSFQMVNSLSQCIDNNLTASGSLSNKLVFGAASVSNSNSVTCTDNVEMLSNGVIELKSGFSATKNFLARVEAANCVCNTCDPGLLAVNMVSKSGRIKPFGTTDPAYINKSEDQEKLNIRLFPNPGKEQFNIVIDGSLSQNDASYSVFNMAGKILLKGNFKGNRTRIDLSHFAPGIYQVAVERDAQKVFSKIVKHL